MKITDLEKRLLEGEPLIVKSGIGIGKDRYYLGEDRITYLKYSKLYSKYKDMFDKPVRIGDVLPTLIHKIKK